MTSEIIFLPMWKSMLTSLGKGNVEKLNKILLSKYGMKMIPEDKLQTIHTLNNAIAFGIEYEIVDSEKHLVFTLIYK